MVTSGAEFSLNAVGYLLVGDQVDDLHLDVWQGFTDRCGLQLQRILIPGLGDTGGGLGLTVDNGHLVCSHVLDYSLHDLDRAG